MARPTLVIMAAGMGSRYGGLKQMDPVDAAGHIIMDFSLYDAQRAGFERVVFIIKHEFEEAFRATVGRRAERRMDVRYAFQTVDDLPAGFAPPEGRVKPWGTAHALLCARDLIDGPFAVINADDYYGVRAFADQYAFLSALPEDSRFHYAMSGYHLANTLTENGYVSRGVCETDGSGRLLRITERVRIESRNGLPAYSEDGGETWTALAADTPVSMNLWGFSRDYLDEAWAGFPAFLTKALAENPLKAEYYLPSVVERLLREKDARIDVIETPDKWFGVTYAADKPAVEAAVARMQREGLYPEEF